MRKIGWLFASSALLVWGLILGGVGCVERGDEKVPPHAPAALEAGGAAPDRLAPDGDALGEGTEYFSDYFVFVSSVPTAGGGGSSESAADSHSSLVVPIDVNWERRSATRTFVELKAWRGTPTAWPMLYYVG